MNLEKIRLASEQFKKEKMSDYYNTEAIWLALDGLFDALLDPGDPTEVFQEVPCRAECAFCLDESGSYVCIQPAHSAYQAKGDGSIDRATDGRITEESIIGLPQEILADGCDPDPADDGPEINILRN